MSTLITTPSTATAYQARFPGLLALWERARHLIPSGINHDVRRIVPFPRYGHRSCRRCMPPCCSKGWTSSGAAPPGPPP
jgi:hypothetical protein